MKEIVTTEKARQGKTHQGVRYVLAISLTLVVVAFALVYASYFA
jgi:hypothetical protein